jgi:4-hydroxy-2-oxoheptanedioate aldolase
MKAANRLQVALDEGRQAFGCWQMIPGANVSRTLARTGVDWVLVDGEHGNIDGKNIPPPSVVIFLNWQTHISSY